MNSYLCIVYMNLLIACLGKNSTIIYIMNLLGRACLGKKLRLTQVAYATIIYMNLLIECLGKKTQVAYATIVYNYESAHSIPMDKKI